MVPLSLSRRVLIAAPFAGLAGLPAERARAGGHGFAHFLAEIRREARARGIRTKTIDVGLAEAHFLPRVIALDRHQPEHRLSFDEYLGKVVTPRRKDAARRHLADDRGLLDRIGRRFGVDPRFIVALWAIESNFGETIGRFPVISALATLGYGSRRGGYFGGELIAALRILDAGDVGARRMVGSWAGAMGQCQFMPTTYLRYAVDFDGDGRRNIWTDRADALASMAHFIARLGWRDGENWGEKVRLPPGFNTRLAGLKVRRPVAAWRRLGISAAGRRPLPDDVGEASLLLPAGAGGPAFLVFANFRTLLRWNRSTYFAAAVGYLADSMGRA